jgi:hypothetical protein
MDDCACLQGDYCQKVASSDDSLSTGAVLGIVLGTSLAFDDDDDDDDDDG